MKRCHGVLDCQTLKHKIHRCKLSFGHAGKHHCKDCEVTWITLPHEFREKVRLNSLYGKFGQGKDEN